MQALNYIVKVETNSSKMLFIKDEYHFVLVCDFNTELRKLYIKKYLYVRPNMAKCIDLLNSDSILTLQKNLENM